MPARWWDTSVCIVPAVSNASATRIAKLIVRWLFVSHAEFSKQTAMSGHLTMDLVRTHLVRIIASVSVTAPFVLLDGRRPDYQLRLW